MLVNHTSTVLYNSNTSASWQPSYFDISGNLCHQRHQASAYRSLDLDFFTPQRLERLGTKSRQRPLGAQGTPTILRVIEQTRILGPETNRCK